VAQALADGGALAHVAGQEAEDDVAAAVLLLEDLAGPVGRVVVDDDDLLLDRAEVDGADLVEQRGDRRPLVVDRDDDRQLQRSAPRAPLSR